MKNILNNNFIKTRYIAWKIITESHRNKTRISVTIKDIFDKSKNNISSKDKRFIIMIVQGTIRLSKRLDLEIDEVYKGNFKTLKFNYLTILRIGVFQIYFMDDIPEYASVSTTVELTKYLFKDYSNLTNALLRKIIDNKRYITEPDNSSTLTEISNYYSHPEWIINKWIKYKNKQYAIDIAKWNNEPPNIWFRVITTNYSIDEFVNYLEKNKLEYKQFNDIPEYFCVSNSQNIIHSKIFNDGYLTVQDPSAGLVVKLLDPQKNDLIIDTCAAPGGKLAYIYELTKNENILAYDSSQDRLNDLRETLKRLRYNKIKINLLDCSKEILPLANKVLIDVPCSGTGVMSKRSDLRWRRKIDDIYELAELQNSLLNNISKFINPGGTIVYSTCSIEYEENWNIINNFIKYNPKYKIVNAKNYLPDKYVDSFGALQIYSPNHKIDGGFAVRLNYAL